MHGSGLIWFLFPFWAAFNVKLVMSCVTMAALFGARMRPASTRVFDALLVFADVCGARSSEMSGNPDDGEKVERNGLRRSFHHRGSVLSR